MTFLDEVATDRTFDKGLYFESDFREQEADKLNNDWELAEDYWNDDTIQKEVKKEMKKLTDYGGTFLKANNVVNEQDLFLITNIAEVKEDDRTALRLSLKKGEAEFSFDLNQTNIKFLTSKGFVEAESVVGHNISFKKVLVRNPKTNMEVDGLRICDIQ